MENKTTNWVPPKFGATYQLKVYVDSAGSGNPASIELSYLKQVQVMMTNGTLIINQVNFIGTNYHRSN